MRRALTACSVLLFAMVPNVTLGEDPVAGPLTGGGRVRVEAPLGRRLSASARLREGQW
jgi:hypothetical protein